MTGLRPTPSPAWSKKPASLSACATASCGNQSWGKFRANLTVTGLAEYFPPHDGEAARGSDALTAYLQAATHEAASINPAFALPDDVRAPMERGLIAFVGGKIQREFWSPRKDLDVRKLAELEALSRCGKTQGRMLGSITIAPNQWPTSAVIDWLQILKRVADVPKRDERMAEATQILKSRLSYQGTKLVFCTEKDDHWWWLMVNGDVNTARLMQAVMDDPAWKDDMGRLANGFIARQQKGAWHITTAILHWTKSSTASKETLSVTHTGAGKPWLTLQSLAAVQLKEPFNAGYQIKRNIKPVEQAVKGTYTRGDVLRITLDVNASADMTWVAMTDPIPGGATNLGGGLGRDSEIATKGEKKAGSGCPAF